MNEKASFVGSSSERVGVDTSRVIAMIDEQRVRRIERAVELGVDKDDFLFESGSERIMWDEICREFDEQLTKLGPTWTAD